MSLTQNHVYRGSEGVAKKVAVDLPPLGPKEILIKITHSGLCATDVICMSWGVALGHEGVGIVEKIGDAVTHFKIGDRAGGGYHRNSCGHCRYCLTGNDIWCYERVTYAESDHDNGTFGDYYIGTETYLHKIPDTLSSEDAAPLQCAGATVYKALVDVVKPAKRVGIIGIGGLGHLAIQFAAKLGAEVVVFSTSAGKEEEARTFGASEFYLLNEPERVQQPVNTLIVAGNSQPAWEKFFKKNVLARQGTVVPLVAPHGDIHLPSWPLFFEGYNLHSSLVASRAEHDDMLSFAAHHGIKPKIETFELSEAGFNEAIEKLNSGKMRYRGVLVAK